MENKNLPLTELKEFGIVNDDLSFSKKLNEDDINKFLNGYTIVADNLKNRATFQLTDNNSKLKVIFLERDKSMKEILEKCKDSIQYVNMKSPTKFDNKLTVEKKAFVLDKEINTVVEFDMVKDLKELTAIIDAKKDLSEINCYKIELQKLESFLQDKMQQFPEVAKEIMNDLNIVSKEIVLVEEIFSKLNPLQEQKKSDIQLNANRSREKEDEYDDYRSSLTFRR